MTVPESEDPVARRRPRKPTMSARDRSGDKTPREGSAAVPDRSANWNDDTVLGALPVETAESASHSRIGSYEILREIARGGMGVVYQARQLGVGRIVALKMTLAGQFAGDKERQRFRAEAEAAGQLDHPQIVPIFEVGEHDGQLFFSMRYVEGQSLKEVVAEGPLPATRAAELMLRIARAVEYAHSRGIIHRDLKPANVLIEANGFPQVTDFGLAKRETVDSGMTSTGQILGTPSFMPPEQALGQTDRVGPLSDVYSLGAMLYCLLTGRPPFQAATVMDTLLQVIQDEPISPRQLVHNIPVDLETMTRKCLEKKPEARYASAAAFADDLERWLDGRPIQARAISTTERTWRWMKRNRILTALIASLSMGITLSTVFGMAWRGQLEEARIANKTVGNQRDALRDQSEKLKSALADRSAAFDSLSERSAAEDLRRGTEECNADRIDQGLLYFARGLGTVPKSAESLKFKIQTNVRAWLPRLNRLVWLDESPRLHARLVLSPDGTRLAVTEFTGEGLRGHQTKVLEVATGREVRPPLTHTTRVDTAAFRRSNESLTFLEENRKIGDEFHAIQHEWDLKTGAESVTELPMLRTLGRSAISPDGSLAALSTQAGIQLWNLDQRMSGPVVFPVPQDANWSQDFTPDGQYLVFSVRRNGVPQRPVELHALDVARQETESWELVPGGTWNFGVIKDRPFLLCRERLWRKPVTAFEKVTSDGSLGIVAGDPTNELLAIGRGTEPDVARIWSTRKAAWVGQSLVGRSIQLSCNNGVAAAVTDHALRIWKLAGYAAADDDDRLQLLPATEPEQFVRLVELGTGKRLDERGQFVRLSAGEWKERLDSTRKPPRHSSAGR
jgi:serine/threonine protein kinase